MASTSTSYADILQRYPNHFFADGQWHLSTQSQGGVPVFNASTAAQIGTTANCNAQDVQLAVQAAHLAFRAKPWKQSTGAQRSVYLQQVAQCIQNNKEELAKMEAFNMGKPLQESLCDIDDVAACFAYYAQLAIELDAKQGQPVEVANPIFASRIRYEPIGVAACILPFNYPLLMLAWKVAPCLAAGSTCVVKPSEFTPITAMRFAELTANILPPGVFNLILGYGASCGQPLIEHPQVSKVAFTGSVATGTHIAKLCAAQLKKCTLELGGKSPVIVFPDALSDDPIQREKDLRQMVDWLLVGIVFNGGQVCSATSRLILHSTIADEVVSRIVREMKDIAVNRTGHALDPVLSQRTGVLGPLVSQSQQSKVLAYVADASKEGAEILCGGSAPSHLSSGFFVEPTLIKAQRHMKVWREEIFGPVLSYLTFENEEEALHIANDTEFGLAGAVFSQDEGRLKRVSEALECGIVWINSSQPTLVESPWGGIKRSGIGRELGPFGLQNYLEIKQLTSYVGKEPFAWFVDHAAFSASY